MLDHVAAQVVADRLVVPDGPGQQVLHPIRGGLTGVLGNGPTVRPRHPDSSPSTKARARRRGSTRANRALIRPISSSKACCQRSGLTLWPAATARSSSVDTTGDDQPVAVSHAGTTRRQITIYGWSI